MAIKKLKGNKVGVRTITALVYAIGHPSGYQRYGINGHSKAKITAG